MAICSPFGSADHHDDHRFHFDLPEDKKNNDEQVSSDWIRPVINVRI